MERQSISQTDLARKTGISRPNISNYLKGKNVPGLEVLEKFSAALGAPIDRLVSEFDWSMGANKMLNTSELRKIRIEAERHYRAKFDFEWKGQNFKSGDEYLGNDIALLLYLNKIEVSQSSYNPIINTDTVKPAPAANSPSDRRLELIRHVLEMPDGEVESWLKQFVAGEFVSPELASDKNKNNA